jgi:PAS domain-containing protein
VAVASTVLLADARSALEAAHRDAAQQAARELTGEMLARVTADELGDAPSPSFLRRLAVRSGFVSVRVVEPGEILRETGTEAPSEDAAAAIRAGRSVVLRRPPGVALAPSGFRVLHPVVAPSGQVVRVVDGIREAAQLARIERWWRWVVAAHIAGILALALAGLAFADWVGRPYRKIAAAAGEAGLTLPSSDRGVDPDDLAGAVRAVVAKLHDQEAALDEVEREAGGLGDLVRFAGRAATTMSTGVLVVDRRGQVAALNPAAGDLLGVSVHDARDRPAAAAQAEPSAGVTRVPWPVSSNSQPSSRIRARRASASGQFRS